MSLKDAEIARHCIVCSAAIPESRLELRPMVQTCSPECADVNIKYQRKQTLKKWRQTRKG